MIKKMVFTNDPVGLEQPHAGGGCLLPASFPWPKDRTGKDLLHVLTIPADWLIDSQCGWLSLRPGGPPAGSTARGRPGAPVTAADA